MCLGEKRDCFVLKQKNSQQHIVGENYKHSSEWSF